MRHIYIFFLNLALKNPRLQMRTPGIPITKAISALIVHLSSYKIRDLKLIKKTLSKSIKIMSPRHRPRNAKNPHKKPIRHFVTGRISILWKIESREKCGEKLSWKTKLECCYNVENVVSDCELSPANFVWGNRSSFSFNTKAGST